MKKKNFETTRWSLIVAAQDSDIPDSRQALEELCEIYWQPVYAFVRYQGHGMDQAQDLTQGFFLHILGNRFLEEADQGRGRFRSYLLTSLKNFLADVAGKNRAMKRGGDWRRMSEDVSELEKNLAIQLDKLPNAELAFDKSWAASVLDTAETRLASEYERRGKLELYGNLQPALRAGRRETSYREIASSMGMNEAAIRVAVRRLRMRYAEIIRSLIRDTVLSSDDVRDEIRYLLTLI